MPQDMNTLCPNTLPPAPSALPFESFDALMTHLNTVGLFHMDLRLNRTLKALARVSSKQQMHVVQIIGTNGKGSTSTFLAALSQAHGLRTGLYTSPHFVSPCERIRIDGTPLTEDEWLAWGNIIYAAAPALTYFEFMTVLAFCAFQAAGVQLAVMEAGLGGRHDATTALPVDMLCYTPIALDHETVLGDTVEQIAADKAAAIRHGAPVISGPQEAACLHILQQAATQAGSTFATANAPLPESTSLRMLGLHQQENARLALSAWQLLCRQKHITSDPAAIERGLLNAFIPGRLQYIAGTAHMPPLLLDGGHNPHGLRALAAAVAHLQLQPRALIFTCLADKNLEGMLQPLRQLAGNSPIFVPPLSDNPRACNNADLALHIGPQAVPAPSVAAALEQACQSPASTPEACVLVCGSLYLLAEFFTLHKEYLTASY